MSVSRVWSLRAGHTATRPRTAACFVGAGVAVSFWIAMGAVGASPNEWSPVGAGFDGAATEDYLGVSVSMSADGATVVVGASGYSDGRGHARIYAHDGLGWAQVGGDIEGQADGDAFGDAVSLSSDGQTVAIGAPFGDGNGASSGHVRVFGFDGSGWVQVGGDIEGDATFDQFGDSVALSADGDTVAIGAPFNDGNGTSAGHVRVFRLESDAWVQVGNDIEGAAAFDQFGWSAALSADGDTVAIGAPFNDGNAMSAGHVRVFGFDGSGWVQVGGDIEGEAGDKAGRSVSLSSDGRTVAVGAPASPATGHVRVLTFNGSSWVQVGDSIDGDAANDRSGLSVSLSADGATVAVGTPYHDGNGEDAGLVRVLAMDGSNWVQIGTDTRGDAADDRFGFSVSLSADGSRIAIGAPYSDGIGSNSGRAQTYSAPASVPSAPGRPSVVAGDGSVTVTWSASSGNGAEVTEYRVSASPDGASCVTSGGLSCVVSGLTNGTDYTFSVTATNSAGTSDASAASETVAPAGAPAVPPAPAVPAAPPVPPVSQVPARTPVACPSVAVPFGDVAGSFAVEDIGCLAGLGVTVGTSATTYSPDGLVTREEMAAFLGRTWRALGNACPSVAVPFGDVAGSFAVEDIGCLAGLEITTGTSATTYSPDRLVTREEMAAFLARLIRANTTS